jgi:hypothetical protein
MPAGETIMANVDSIHHHRYLIKATRLRYVGLADNGKSGLFANRRRLPRSRR